MNKSPAMNTDDVHVIINDWESKYIGEAKCYGKHGTLLWKVDALCKGIEGARWSVRNGDTPPGLYRAGELVITQSTEPVVTWNAYGAFFIDLIEQQNQESKYNRGGIGWHGGGSSLPDPLAPYQKLVPTLGCIRSHNIDMARVIVPQLEKLNRIGADMWITVNQFG